MQYSPELAARDGREPVSNVDLIGDKTLTENEETVVYDDKVPDDKIRFWGAGGKNRQAADPNFVYAKFVASGAGAGSAGDVLTGDLIAVITDSQGRRVLAEYTIGSLADLAAYADERPTDRMIMAALEPYAKPGRRMQLRLVGDARSDGKQVDGDASNVGLAYGEIDL